MTGSLSKQKKKAFERLDLLKLQREKRFAVREQFELEHEDASINAGTGQSWDDRRQEEEYFNFSEMMKKSKFNRGGSKFGYQPLLAMGR